jgi:hypothetical protein
MRRQLTRQGEQSAEPHGPGDRETGVLREGADETGAPGLSGRSDTHGRRDLGKKSRSADQDEVAKGEVSCSQEPDWRKASRSRARSAWS